MLFFDILTKLFSNVKNFLIAALVTLLPVLYAMGAISSKRKERLKELESENKVLREANKIENEINSLSPDDVNKRLDKWMRD